MSTPEYRIEHDTMGEVRVPKNALYAAQTQRAVENFPISGQPIERELIAGLALIKGAGARVRAARGLLDPAKAVPVTVALVESPAGFLVQQRPAKGLLAGLWQPLLWESEHLLQAEVLARLAALGVDTGTAVPEALPAAKHIFSHIEWLLSGVALTVPEQAAPAGCVWASREELRTTYTLPGAFAAYKDRMLG